MDMDTIEGAVEGVAVPTVAMMDEFGYRLPTHATYKGLRDGKHQWVVQYDRHGPRGLLGPNWANYAVVESLPPMTTIFISLDPIKKIDV